MDERLLRARFGVVHATHLQSLWLRVVDKVNSFLSANESRVMFDCENVAVSFSDLRDVPLIQVLSEAEHPSHGHDILFLVINDLLMRYNNFIISVSMFKNSRSVHEPEEIHPMCDQSSLGRCCIRPWKFNRKLLGREIFCAGRPPRSYSTRI